MEIDDITPKSISGNIKGNLQLLHRHCHDIKTKDDSRAIKAHKNHKKWQKTMSKFNSKNWK